MTMHRATLLLLTGLASLGGCKPNDRPSGAPASHHAAGFDARAIEAAQAAIRTDLSSVHDPQFRGVQIYSQALPDHWAVCGQVSPYADDQALFVPFVAVLTRTGTRWSSTPDARFIGTSVTDADRTYLALVAHCYDKGGPGNGPVQSITPAPPMPNEVPRPSGASTGDAAPAAVPLTTATAIPASGNVTMRQNANLHATPKGDLVRVVPQGTALHVFATSPGGWLQVGDTAPWGWVHQSMVVGPD
jgi:hypothetical protein